MTKYHTNQDTGDSGACRAEKDNCPFGSEDSHYTSLKAARAAYEAEQDLFSMTSHALSMRRFDKRLGDSYRVGEMNDVNFDQLVKTLGQPIDDSGDGKVQARWTIETPHGIITIYDFKSDKPLGEVDSWSIGGNAESTKDSLKAIAWTKNLITSGKRQYPFVNTPKTENDWVTQTERRQWSTISSYTPPGEKPPADQLDVAVVTNTQPSAANAVKPMNWGEMGSSEKDLWMERQAKSAASGDARRVRRSELFKKVSTEPQWVKTLDDSNLNRLAYIMAGHSVSDRESFDKHGWYITLGNDITPKDKEAVKTVREEIASRIIEKSSS